MQRRITTIALTIAWLTALSVSAVAQRSRTPKPTPKPAPTQTSAPVEAVTLTPPAQPATAQPVPARPMMPAKKRVMVMDFDYSGLRRWWTGEWDIGRTITTRLFYQLSQTGIYDVLESSLEQALTEQQDRSFSERRDPSTAAKVG